MEEKERMVRLLNQYIDGPGLTVVIGAEHSSPDLRRSAWLPPPSSTAAPCAPSASSARRACTTRARSRWWTARRRPCLACSRTRLARFTTQDHGRPALHDQDVSGLGARRPPTRPPTPPPTGTEPLDGAASARTRRAAGSPAADGGRVRQLPQAHRPRPPRPRRFAAADVLAGSAADRRQLRARAAGAGRRRAGRVPQGRRV